MTDRSSPERRSTARLLAFVFPLCALFTMVAGIVLNKVFSLSEMPVYIALSGIGFGLAFAYLVVSCCRIRRRRWWRTVLSFLCAVGLILISAVSLVIQEIVWDMSTPKPQTLAERLQQTATEAAVSAGRYLSEGDTGTLVSPTWKDRTIGIAWARNDHGILVTSSLVGTVPKGQDGTPRVQQALRSGKLGFPLDHFLEQSRRTDMIDDMFKNWLVMFNDLVADVTHPILGRVKTDGGTLPSAAEGRTLLDEVKKRFEFDGSLDDQKKVPITFVVDEYTYTPGTEGDFTIACRWTCDIRPLLQGGEKIDSSEPATGVLELQFNDGGFLVLDYEKGEVVNPLEEVVKSAQDWSDRQQAKELAKEKTADVKRD